MKIKQDFVTNSSSTGFIFIFKGNQRTDLFKQMVKYEDKFKLFNEYGPGEDYIDVWDIIKELDPLLSSTKQDPWYLPGPLKLNSLLKKIEVELKVNKKTLKEELKRESEEPINWKSSKYTIEYIKENEEKLVKLKKALKNGLDHYIEVSFGDNDGMIQGGRIGYTMDYEGRNINLNQKDFMVMIENQH